MDPNRERQASHHGNGMWRADAAQELLLAETAWISKSVAALPAQSRLWVGPIVGAQTVADEFIVVGAGEDDQVHGDVRCQGAALPFVDDAFGCVVLQHALERRVLPALAGECVRALAPGGELLIVGFNPISLWRGWARRHARACASECAPRLPGRLIALFGHLGVGEFRLEFHGPRWPGAARRMAWDAAGPGLGRAVYVLRGRKQRATIIALRPAPVRRDFDMAPGLVASTRGSTT
jgi:SAM-dependent methyltransferase